MAKNHLVGSWRPGLCDTIYVRSLLVLFLDTPLLPCVHADPVAVGPQDGVDVGVAQHLTMALGLGISPHLRDQGEFSIIS